MEKADLVFLGIIAAFIGVAMFRGALSNAWKQGRGIPQDQDSKDDPYRMDHKWESKFGCLLYAVLGALAIASVFGIIKLSD